MKTLFWRSCAFSALGTYVLTWFEGTPPALHVAALWTVMMGVVYGVLLPVFWRPEEEEEDPWTL